MVRYPELNPSVPPGIRLTRFPLILIPLLVVATSLLAQPDSRSRSTRTVEPKKPVDVATTQQVEQRQHCEKCRGELCRFQETDQWKEALASAQKLLELEAAISGPQSLAVLQAQERIAEAQQMLNQLAAAKETRRQIAEAADEWFGADHWITLSARRALTDFECFEKLTAEQQQRLKSALVLEAKAAGLRLQGKPREALALAEQVSSIRKELLGERNPEYLRTLATRALLHITLGERSKAEPLLKESLELTKEAVGENHPDFATALYNLGQLLRDRGEYAAADPLLHKALELRRELLGESHADFGTSLHGVAILCRRKGEFCQAEPLLQQALDVRRAALGEAHPDYSASLNSLASLYRETGEYAKAEPLCRRSLELNRQLFGEKHPDVARSLNSLALLSLEMGEYARAESQCLKALDIREKYFGVRHPDYARSLNNLARIYELQRQFDKALKVCREALEIRKEVLGEKNSEYAVSLSNLGVLYRELGELDKAEPLVRQALDVHKQIMGDRHPRYALCLYNLALILLEKKDYAHAEPLLQDVLAIRKESLGERHPDYATSLNSLATLYRRQGQPAKGAPLCREALEIASQLLEEAAVVQSQAGQLDYARKIKSYADNFLSCNVQGDHAATYQVLLQLRGTVMTRQAFVRARRSTQPELQPLVMELQAVSKQLAAMYGGPADTEASADAGHAERLKTLRKTRRRLERELAEKSGTFQKFQQRGKVQLADLQRVLPARTVIIDFMEYHGDLAAFVISGKSVSRIELGPLAPMATAVEKFRRDLHRKHPLTGADDDPALVLRDKLWQPLVASLGDATVVLISPDRELNRLPFAAIPGNGPNKYLIDDLSLAIIPVPQLLPELLAPRPKTETAAAPPTLLIVGDVDFNAQPKQASISGPPLVAATGGFNRRRDGATRKWERLPGSRDELLIISDSFRTGVKDGKLTELRGANATESAVRKLAGQHEYLHFATHGFFNAEQALGPKTVVTTTAAPANASPAASKPGEQLRTHPSGPGVIAGPKRLPPGLSTGIVLAGANHPLADEDGLLTALEIEDLDWSKTELAVLSACETGLGEAVGGEGVLGLQRAMQLAGARTSITSLWKVSDRETKELMTQFYAKFFDAGPGTLECLRKAQLFILDDAIVRGMILKDEGAAQGKGRTPPYYWAAFILAGDWR